MEAIQFSGADYVPARDLPRLSTQIERIESITSDGKWRTVTSLVSELKTLYPGVNFPENSVQAQLRNLRKIGYKVKRRYLGNGLYEYMVAGKTEAAGIVVLPA